MAVGTGVGVAVGGTAVAVGGAWVAVAVGDGGTRVGVRVGGGVGVSVATAASGDAARVGGGSVGVAVGVAVACWEAAETLGSGGAVAAGPCRPQATSTRVATTMTWTSGASWGFIGGDHSRAGKVMRPSVPTRYNRAAGRAVPPPAPPGRPGTEN